MSSLPLHQSPASHQSPLPLPLPHHQPFIDSHIHFDFDPLSIDFDTNNLPSHLDLSLLNHPVHDPLPVDSDPLLSIPTLIDHAPDGPSQPIQKHKSKPKLKPKPKPKPKPLPTPPQPDHNHLPLSTQEHPPDLPISLSLPTTSIPQDLDPFLASLHPQATSSPAPSLPTLQPPQTPRLPAPPHLPRAKLAQVRALRQAADDALREIALTLAGAGQDGAELAISPALDRHFAELHSLAPAFKKDQLALIWPQCVSNRALKANITFPAYHTPAYFAVRKANIAFVGEYVLYAMPGEEAYGKNDIVFACEGFLPLVLDKEMVLEDESWRIFNELKVQIYIQRLDQFGRLEADTRVLPNLFVESLSSYSGHQVPPSSELAFDKLAAETKQEIVDADARLDVLVSRHPYRRFASWTLSFLQRCAARVSEQERACQSSSDQLGSVAEEASQRRQGEVIQKDICVDNTACSEDDGANNCSQALDCGSSKGRYNPYKLGRGKGAASQPRRRWTQSEHELLLEEVRMFCNKYDCMAQIIKRHGKFGEVSKVLREQNNVSLKDKARNLTMEWERHGYPADKPWLKEAFARFSVKAQKRQRTSVGELQLQEEEEGGGGGGCESSVGGSGGDIGVLGAGGGDGGGEGVGSSGGELLVECTAGLQAGEDVVRESGASGGLEEAADSVERLGPVGWLEEASGSGEQGQSAGWLEQAGGSVEQGQSGGWLEEASGSGEQGQASGWLEEHIESINQSDRTTTTGAEAEPEAEAESESVQVEDGAGTGAGAGTRWRRMNGVLDPALVEMQLG